MSKPDKTTISPDYTAGFSVATLPKLMNAGRWRLESLYARRTHDFYWITRGQGQVAINGAPRGFGPNTVLFIPAGSVYRLVPGNNWLGYAAFLPDMLPVPVPNHPMIVKATSIFDQGQVTGYFDQISTENDSNAAGSEQVVESYMTLLGVWLERNQGRSDWSDSTAKTAADRLIAGFLKRLENGHVRTHAVSFYAEALNVTPTHLSRLCNERFGKPASAVIQDRVLVAAKQLLSDGDLPVGAVSERLGLASPAYFARIFRARTGQTPSAFREAVRNPATPLPRRAVGKIARK